MTALGDLLGFIVCGGALLALFFACGYAPSIIRYLEERTEMEATHRWVVGMGWVCREHGSGCWRCGWSPATKATPTSRG